MTNQVMRSKTELKKLSVEELREGLYKDCLVSLTQYFEGRGNGPEAKVASIVYTAIGRENATRNNEKSLALVEAKLRKEGIFLK